MSKTEKLYQWEGKGGQGKVSLPFLKGVTLDCCICSLWRLTKCSVCRFAGMMASMTWQRRKMDRCPASWLGGLPLLSAVWPQLATPSLEHGAPQPSPVSFALSERDLHLGRCHGQSSVPRLRNTALVAAVSRKAETTKYGPCDSGTEPDACSALAPGEQMVSQDGSNKSTAESCDALAANWTMTRQWGLHQ